MSHNHHHSSLLPILNAKSIEKYDHTENMFVGRDNLFVSENPTGRLKRMIICINFHRKQNSNKTLCKHTTYGFRLIYIMQCCLPLRVYLYYVFFFYFATRFCLFLMVKTLKYGFIYLAK